MICQEKVIQGFFYSEIWVCFLLLFHPLDNKVILFFSNFTKQKLVLEGLFISKDPFITSSSGIEVFDVTIKERSKIARKYPNWSSNPANRKYFTHTCLRSCPVQSAVQLTGGRTC